MEETFELLESSTVVLILVALGLSIYVVRTFGKGVLNVLFFSLVFSVLFLLGYFVFHELTAEVALYQLSEGTTHLWAHSIVYLSMLSLIWGGYRLKSMATASDLMAVEGFGRRDKSFFGVLGAVYVLIVLLAPALEPMIAHSTLVQVFDAWGLHHLTVFLLGAVSVWYLFYIKGNWGLLSSSISLLIAYIFFVGLQHFWETLTESWRVIEVSETAIEGVELVLVILALVFLCLAQWKILKFVKN